MKVYRPNLLLMSALVVLGTRPGTVALDVRNRMWGEGISPMSGSVAAVVVPGKKLNKDENSMVTGKCVLLAQIDRDLFTPGEQILLEITLRNDTDQEIYIIESSPLRDNHLEIKNAMGEEVPLSEKGKNVVELPVLRNFVSRIGPGVARQFKINVRELYDLSVPDTYTITIRRNILLEDRKKYAEVESNPVEVIVE